MSFTVISAFSGCGGSSLGYQMAGGKVRLAVENDSNAVAIDKANFPGTPIHHGDIFKLPVDECLEKAGIESGELDIFDGSPPCQGFSTAGRRKFGDDRNQLFREYIRLLKGICPRVLVMENVSGMVKGKMKLIFAECLRELKAAGYKVRARLINTKYYGVPQSRQRLIFIGVRNDIKKDPTYPVCCTRPISAGSALHGIQDQGFDLTPEAAKWWPRMKPGESASKYHPKGHLFGLIKIHPGRPSPTLLRSGGASRLAHWNQPRFIGNKERARLASFPDEFVWIGTDVNVYDRIGNSVPPLFMKAIAEHIRDAIL